MDYKNLSDKEFIKLYAEGEVNKNDLIKYIQTICDIKALYGELLEACNTYNKSELIFSPDLSEIVGETGMSDYDNLRYRRVCDARGFVEEILGLYKIEGNQSTKPQQELIDILPEQLKTDEAVKIFQQAIDAKLIEKTNEGLKWKETNQLLAYFATKLSDRFNLSTKLNKDGNKTTAWKPFEELFNLKEGTLKVAKQNWMRLNLDFEPTGFEKVKVLF